jgi:hypothetical protein
MRIDRENSETSKQIARKVFDKVVRRVAEERGIAPEPSR